MNQTMDERDELILEILYDLIDACGTPGQGDLTSEEIKRWLLRRQVALGILENNTASTTWTLEKVSRL